MHNLNQILLPKQMYKMMREHTGLRPWHHYTAGWSGTQHWSASTSGDNGGGRTALFDQLNLGMSGFLNTSCDVMNVNKDEELQSLHFCHGCRSIVGIRCINHSISQRKKRKCTGIM